MPAPSSATFKKTISNNDNKSMMEYEVLVIPPPSPTNETYAMQQQPLTTRTKRINCNGRNGRVFWIPEGYRPVLVRTADLALLAGTESLPSPSYSSDSDDSSC